MQSLYGSDDVVKRSMTHVQPPLILLQTKSHPTLFCCYGCNLFQPIRRILDKYCGTVEFVESMHAHICTYITPSLLCYMYLITGICASEPKHVSPDQ